ncbi:heparanase-like protein 1 [Impatiens glandulifera]|uniref:heparanase-like protein 1 n=1 Tax=Impatiens glandulifera TaxID=253017 RepID=UPI001FB17A6F|nr:heparanase-like protein 1 [Impatiens glandulifera]
MSSSMGFPLVMFIFLFHFLTCNSSIWAQKSEDVTIIINGTTPVSTTDENYICATIDWWPDDKCNYNQCPWGSSSVLNLDLSKATLEKAIEAFGPLRIRIGGSLQDQVLYNVGNLKTPCHPFKKMSGGLFGFSRGCLPMKRWDKVNKFFSKTGALVTFGLNALYGRHETKKKGTWGGNWDSSNARDFIKYTISKGYNIDSWEFGNELSGSGVGASVGSEQYGKDVIKLKSIIDELYNQSQSKIPILLAPGGFYDKQWFNKFLQVSGSSVVNAVSHHIYNLGPGVDRKLVNKILDPNFLSRVTRTFIDLQQTIRTHGPWSSAWVGEAGGAYNSGGRNISDTFVYSFWYLDQLGMAAKYNTKVYCRQSLIGGNYGLLDMNTYAPNPDYFSALLWHRLMGKEVLSVKSIGSPYLRSYAHCSKGNGGITLLLINLSKNTNFTIKLENLISLSMKNMTENTRLITRSLKSTFSWVGKKTTSNRPDLREEYHLTPKDGYLRSKTMLLNGQPLSLRSQGGGDSPRFSPALIEVDSPISIPSLSIKFVQLPKFDAPCCKRQV